MINSYQLFTHPFDTKMVYFVWNQKVWFSRTIEHILRKECIFQCFLTLFIPLSSFQVSLIKAKVKLWGEALSLPSYTRSASQQIRRCWFYSPGVSSVLIGIMSSSGRGVDSARDTLIEDESEWYGKNANFATSTHHGKSGHQGGRRVGDMYL